MFKIFQYLVKLDLPNHRRNLQKAFYQIVGNVSYHLLHVQIFQYYLADSFASKKPKLALQLVYYAIQRNYAKKNDFYKFKFDSFIRMASIFTENEFTKKYSRLR